MTSFGIHPSARRTIGSSHASATRRAAVLLQLVIGWLPIWALFTALILSAHDTTPFRAGLVGLRMIVTAAPLALLVPRITHRVPWPRPFRLSFILIHLAAAALFASGWVLTNSALESVLQWRLVIAVGYSVGPFLVLGVWIYVMITSVLYATQATERALMAEAMAAKSQLAALRSQLNPHFLFNALHTVVHLIPKEPARAAHAAEQLAGLLRSTLEDEQELVTLGEEWSFIERYLQLESLRFGDRLVVVERLAEDSLDTLIPHFALQTLVENAVRHGATPNVLATTVTVGSRVDEGVLELRVHDDGPGVVPGAGAGSEGTGLERLRERLHALYGAHARLTVETGNGDGFTGMLRIPVLEPGE